jgi:signal transduction histidine kinase
MRRRLLLVLLLFSATAVTAFALPLLSSTAAERTQRFVISRTADLDRFAALATGDRSALAAELTAYTALYGEPVLVVDAQRQVVAQSGDLAPAAVAGSVDAALRNQPAAPVPSIRPWSASSVVFTRPVGTGTSVAGVVVLRASTERAAADVTVRWAWVLAGALLAALVCVALSQAVARWLLRPLADLEGGVRAVASGLRRAHVPSSSGPRELRALSSSFNRMSDAVSEAADQQRRLIADTSHQLRNPLAALRLRMDTLSGQVDPAGLRAYDAGVAEVERLESLLDGLLALATADSTATEVAAGGREPSLTDLGSIVSDRADFWGAPFTPDAGMAVLVRCPESDVAQVLDVLLDNALKYGGSARVHVGADRTAGIGWVEVVDDGPGMSPDELAMAKTRFWRGATSTRGTGLGLAIADRLATARGGSLTLTSADGLRARLTLPLEPAL